MPSFGAVYLINKLVNFLVSGIVGLAITYYLGWHPFLTNAVNRSKSKPWSDFPVFFCMSHFLGETAPFRHYIVATLGTGHSSGACYCYLFFCLFSDWLDSFTEVYPPSKHGTSDVAVQGTKYRLGYIYRCPGMAAFCGALFDCFFP